MDSPEWAFFQQYLLFPSLVALVTALASAVASYQATYKLNQKNRREEREVKLSDLEDKLVLEINRLLPLFEKLRTDFDKDNFFSFRNIELISNSKWRLVALQQDIILFEGELRKQILECIDNISSLVDELNVLENNPAQGFNDLKSKLTDAIKEDRVFRLELLKMGIHLEKADDGSLTPKYITKQTKKQEKEQRDESLLVVNEIRQTLLVGVNDSQKQLDTINADTARRRDRLVAKIIDIQNKLKDLQNILTGY